MTLDPEILERSRMRFLRGYVLGALVFLLLWLTRFFFRAGCWNSTPIGYAVLTGLVFSALVFSYYLLRLSLLNAQIGSDQTVAEAVNNELFQYSALRAWKPAFIAAVTTPLLLALVAFVYPVIDIVFVALTSIVAGAFAYVASLYLMCRAS